MQLRSIALGAMMSLFALSTAQAATAYSGSFSGYVFDEGTAVVPYNLLSNLSTTDINKDLNTLQTWFGSLNVNTIATTFHVSDHSANSILSATFSLNTDAVTQYPGYNLYYSLGGSSLITSAHASDSYIAGWDDAAFTYYGAVDGIYGISGLAGTNGETEFFGIGIYDGQEYALAAEVVGRNDSGIEIKYEIATVPEPLTLALLGSGLAGFWAIRRRRAA